jgi:ribosome-binding protein aMBF1 (putative translation factor)
MSSFNEFLNEQLMNPEFRKEYEAMEPEFAIVQAMIDARKKSGLTQKELADKTGINQGDISKIESGTANPSLRTLKRLAFGMNMKLRLEFLPLGRRN